MKSANHLQPVQRLRMCGVHKDFTFLAYLKCFKCDKVRWHSWSRQEVADLIPDVVIRIFRVTILLSAFSSPEVQSASKINKYQGISLGVKQVRKASTFTTFMCRLFGNREASTS